ncbi:MAG: T9SS type A sorting domain-containing protein [Ignavibacteriaceae bacterium]|nr:T9SS type A sorting domain-containing protein [Ignavibacteriaceae bacterium]
MISRYSTQIIYAGSPVDTFDNASDYVFNFIYYNYQYVDSVLLADTYAKSFSSGQYNDTYYQKLWEYSSGITIYLFSSASNILTTMIHQAWLDAGSPTITNVNDDNAIAENFVLHQNYPNPFNPSTKIKYTIPQKVNSQWSIVSLKVYNVLGNEIATLVNESKAAGEYEVEFNGGNSNLSSGVYLCSLTSVEVGTGKIFSSIKKMVLLK